MEHFDWVLRLVDEGFIWGVDKLSPGVQLNAIGMLWRLEQRGALTGNRWEEVEKFTSQRATDFSDIMLSLHTLYSLARADQWDKVSALSFAA